jgi:hypothetical protein
MMPRGLLLTDGVAGEGKYLATYELDSPQVLACAEYLSRFENATPWTRRCLGRAILFKRWACEQAGAADPHPLAKALLMVAAEAPIHGLALPGALQVRHFIASVGAPRHYRAYGA